MAAEEPTSILDHLETFYDECFSEREVLEIEFRGHRIEAGFNFTRPDGTHYSLDEIKAELIKSDEKKLTLIYRTSNKFRSNRYKGDADIVNYYVLVCQHERYIQYRFSSPGLYLSTAYCMPQRLNTSAFI
jgi:hypothetical protein